MSKPHKDSRRPQEAPSRVEPLVRALAWPGVFGWIGTGFAVAGVWFVASAFALRSRAAVMQQPSREARAAAESARRLGFGEWFLRPVLRPKPGGAEPHGREPELVLPEPLLGNDLKRAHMCVRANARASGVFGVFALLVSAFLWGFRRWDPAIRAERAQASGRSGAGDSQGHEP